MKSEEIERLLPQVFQSALRPQAPLAALLEVMESLHQPAEELLAQIEATFNPYRAPDRFVPYLAQWVDLCRFFPAVVAEAVEDGTDVLSTGNGRLRELIAGASCLSQWRGTLEGLRRCLEIATGSSGFEVREGVGGAGGPPRPYHILVRAPQHCVRDRSLIERIIEQEKPAYVTCELEFS